MSGYNLAMAAAGAGLLLVSSANATVIVDTRPSELASFTGDWHDPMLADGFEIGVAQNKLRAQYSSKFRASDVDSGVIGLIRYDHYLRYDASGTLVDSGTVRTEELHDFFNWGYATVYPSNFYGAFRNLPWTIENLADGGYINHRYETNLFLKLNVKTQADGAFTLRLAVVPEPGVWALLISGFGIAGTALRQRRRHAITTAA